MRSNALRWPMVWRVAWRDLLSTIRDKRTLTSTILVPMLMIPLFTIGMPLLMGNLFGAQMEARQKVGVVGTLPNSLRDALKRDEKGPDGKVMRAGLDLVPVTDPIKAVQEGTVDAALKATSALPQRAGDGQGEVELYAKLSNLKAQTGAYAKVQETVEKYNKSLTVDRLKSLGLSETALNPITVKSVDASPPQEKKSGQLAFIIPMFMLQFILSGAMATALDGTAGEKERGTLESLLVSPVRRSEVVAGKLLATTLTALVTAIFSVVGFLLASLASGSLLKGVQNEMSQMMGGQLTLSLGGLSAMLLIAISAALLISAILIALSIYARSYKEAQTYVGPLSLLIVLPAVGLQFADFLTMNLWSYAIPLIGSMIAVLDIVKGSITTSHALLAVLGNLLATFVLGLLALRSFGREEVIFRN